MAPHSSVLAWRIPGMGEPGGLPSMGSHRVRYDWSDLAAAAVCWWIDIPHFVRKRGVKGGIEIVVDQVHGLSYYYLRWDKIQGVGLGGVGKEGHKFSLKIKFERLVRNIPWILCMLSDRRVKFRGEVRFKINISELPALETVLKTKVRSLSRVRLFATSWTVIYRAPQSLGFSRQEYWSGLPFPSPGDLPNPGIEPRSPALQTDALASEPKDYTKWQKKF